MKKTFMIILFCSFSFYAYCAELESKSDAGIFAISLAGACELMTSKGYSAEQLRDTLVKKQGMTQDSATTLTNYSTAWIAKNPGKPCEQVYIDMIDNLSKGK